MGRYSIDRFEANYAICIDNERNSVEILRSRLPKQAREGDWIEVRADGSIVILEEETTAQRAKIKELYHRLFDTKE